MGSEANTRAKLALFPVPKKLSPEPSGMLTPPLQSSVSVPFGWEERPGKPRVCTALITIPMNKSLELPPRLQLMEYYSNMITRSPFPNTFRGASYVGKPVNYSPSFRLSTMHQNSFELYFDSDKRPAGHKETRLLSFWGQKKMTLKLKGSSKHKTFSDDQSCNGRKVNMAKSHFWATMYEGFKHAFTWKSRKSKKRALTNTGLP